ncbi:MAG: vWA domain-containing protein [Candidatus Thorarchaeota archaeon]
MIRETESTSESDNLEVSAKRAWSLAIADFYHPPLPEPVIEYSEDATSFFYITSNDWTVHLNTAGVPLNLDSNVAEGFLHSICHHEIQHYLLCPYDGVTNGMMFSAARKHLNDSMAMFVCNIFADLVVDSALLKRFPALTHERIKISIHDSSIRTRDHSPLWKLIVSTYRTMWGFPVPSGIDIDMATYTASEAITKIARDYISQENRWTTATGKIAKIVADWMPDDEEQLRQDDGDGSGQSITVQIPLDVDGIMGSPIEDRNGDLARRCLDPEASRDLDREMEELAIEVECRGGDLQDLESVYILAGAGAYGKSWIRFWYRAKTRRFLRFDVSEKKLTGAIPLTPMTWRLGDPIEELDLVQSLQAFPVIVPNMSTRRWLRTDLYGDQIENSLPDLLLVIDSSGSMTWSMGKRKISGDYHTALVSAFAAMDTALQKGSRVSAINFSSNIRTCRWTRDRSEIEDILMAYQGGGTVMPVKQIKQFCEDAGSEVMTVIITDAEVSNWNPFVKTVRQLTRRGHKIFIFHIGAKKGKTTKAGKALMKVGGVVIPVESIKELPGLVVSEVQRTYYH